MSQQIDNLIADGKMHAELALAAYVDFPPGKPIDVTKLVDEKMTEAQAEIFAATWRVVDQFNSLTGSSATIFENFNDGQRYLAIRGTQLWDIRDITTNALLTMGVPAALNLQYIAIEAQVETWINNGTLSQFAVCGHSSGGYYSVALKNSFSNNISQAYVYNTPGQWGMPGDLAEFFGVSNTLDPNITIFTTAGGDFSPISNLGLPAGMTTVFVLTDKPWSHSQVNLSDALKALADGTGGGVLIQTVNDDESIRLEAPLKNDGGSNVTIYYKDGSIRNETYDLDGTLISSNYSPASDSTTNFLTITTNPDLAPSQTGADDPTTAVNADNSTLIDTGTYEVLGLGNVNENTNGIITAGNAIISGDWRPGAGEVLHFDSFDEGVSVFPDYQYDLGAFTNQQAAGAILWTPVDPLILDLNGDGVKLTSFAEAPVLFDIDHDGGSKEITGWVSGQDGIVVMDLNDNGQIDGIHETMSEYFNGAVGTGGEAGTKPYANGFAALKSLDSNADSVFTLLDAAWYNVKVWQDANHDGKTDAGELKSLTELGITSIDLIPTAQSGLVNGGNEILATGTFIQNGQTEEAQAARFIANPIGNTISGATVTAQDGQSTYVSSITTGEIIDLTAKGVKNAYGNSGNDTLTGDANDNWLVGGQGSDIFNGGAGFDMLVIDAQDQQQNIHGGDDGDMVQVVGTEGVTLNLAQAEVEVAVGGTGDDIFIGGGRSSVFIRSGDGDDIIIGGAASDALSGENGVDLIDGGVGNDIIRGGRGQDQLMGGTGDDLVFSGQDDDRLNGGSGNDVLRGEQGDDVIDGGDGTDIAEFSGSFSDYRITKLNDTSYRVVDTKAGRDGADTLTNIEKFNFADVSAVDIALDNPMPVKDVLTIADRNGMKLIKVSNLLANDRDWQGDALHITTISDIKGGTLAGSYNAITKEWTPTLTATGELRFTPDPTYTGVMSFKYKVADADGTPGATVFIAGTTTQAEMRGPVFIKTPDMPTDSLFIDQWYLNDINVLPVWQDYTGKGVTIAQFEPGMPFSIGPEVFDYRHPGSIPGT